MPKCDPGLLVYPRTRVVWSAVGNAARHASDPDDHLRRPEARIWIPEPGKTAHRLARQTSETDENDGNDGVRTPQAVHRWSAKNVDAGQHGLQPGLFRGE